MAEFDVNFSSVDSMIRSLQSMDLFDESVQSKLLNAGADKLIDTIAEESGRSEYRLKRISSKLSKSRKIRKGKDGNYSITVTVKGKNDRGERNATVAFVLNYGRREEFGQIEGSYFWTRAVNRTENTIQRVYEEKITEELSERSLI